VEEFEDGLKKNKNTLVDFEKKNTLLFIEKI
jgi:hypothetical protein